MGNIKYKNIFTLESALIAKENNTLNVWVQDFLKGEGKNPKLADVLKKRKNVHIDLIEYNLSKLVRVMGPEKKMTFNEDQNKWKKRINDFVKLIKEGYKPVPLIVTDFWGDYHISDGTHRFEALKKMGINKYWIIFCLEKSNNIKTILGLTINT